MFERISDHLNGLVRGQEICTSFFTAEDSDFVRFNKNSVRQAGAVTQMFFRIDLISGLRHAQANVSLSGEWDDDRANVENVVEDLREMLPELPEDPHLAYSTDGISSEKSGENNLPAQGNVLNAIINAGEGRDLVGIYSSGGIYAGFSNSIGQRNWYSTFNFNFDWTFYFEGDKAAKSHYAGSRWEPDVFFEKIQGAVRHLEVLSRPSVTLPRGKFCVYLSPSALSEFMWMVSRSGFGLRGRKTKQSSLQKLIENNDRLHPEINLTENTEDGFGPEFQMQGFIKPPRVPLILSGEPADCLVSPRSEKEWSTSSNGASDREMPEALELSAGDIRASEVLERLDEGIYIGDLWYLNYSDLTSCRMTGLTRFASFWVKDGEIQAPINVMRFDETLQRVLGENLIGLTREREVFLSAGTYKARSTSSSRMPGALVEDFNFTM
ncbi:MAG: TldE/PmbA family protein [Nitrospinaceae bacterium]|nr:TldE/PmbA family protein [Nitrospinaceae bacterium]